MTLSLKRVLNITVCRNRKRNDISSSGIGKESKVEVISEKDANLNEDEKATVNNFRRQLKVIMG